MTYQEFYSIDLNNSYNGAGSNLYKYFSHSSNYHPLNCHGSCGYVSFIQDLAYYDTFYNDNIIPETYEQNQGNTGSWDDATLISPGVVKQHYPEDGGQLEVFAGLYQNIDFQMKLMNIVNNYYNLHGSEFSYKIGMIGGKYQIILNYFTLLNQSTFEYQTFQSIGQSSPKNASNTIYFENYIKNLLDQGIPVIAQICTDYIPSLTEGKYGGYHSIICYYYDEVGIHANYGWDEGSEDLVIGVDHPDYKYYVCAGYINFVNVPEYHSNNYIINNQYFCGCEMPHTHVYSKRHVYFNNSSHKSYCLCGSYSLRAHGIREGSTYVRNGHTYGTCKDCGATIDLGTGYIIIG